MAIWPDVGNRPFVGRGEELALLRGILEGGREGSATTLLVSGDAGVGKTALLEKASAYAGESSLVLTGGCLPLTSLTVPYQPLRAIARAASRAAGASPLEVFDESASASAVPVAFDRWLDRECQRQPVVLVVDDVHWADPDSLDVLTYLIAGIGQRPLSILATLRNAEVFDGHPLHRWLANVRRLPNFAELALAPLDRLTTGEQLRTLLGGPPHESLVDEVFAHTQGNAYLNRLVSSGLDQSTRHLPAGLPTSLSSAVLQPWHGMSASARELTSTLAVGGRPLAVEEIERVLGDKPSRDEILGLLHEGMAAGLLDVAGGGRYWFHHPLQAEALQEHLPLAELKQWNLRFAAEAERLVGAGTTDLAVLIAASDHNHRAGRPRNAFAYALRAVDSAGDSRPTDVLRLLQRAVDLRTEVSATARSQEVLLDRLRLAAAALGSHEVELGAVEQLLGMATTETRLLDRAELLVRRMHLRFLTGRDFIAAGDVREAVRITSGDPDSWQHAMALAELAQAMLWEGDPEAEHLALRALSAAEHSGNPRALAYALTATAMRAVMSDDPVKALDSASRAVPAAMASGDSFACVHAVLWEANAVDFPASWPYVDLLARRRRELADLGLPHPYLAWLSAVEAGNLLILGDWRACQERLRVALGASPGPLGEVAARLTAARLAAMQGRIGEARAHLARADELFAETTAFLAFEFDAVRAWVLLQAGEAELAYAAAMAGATSDGVPPTRSEWLMPLAARALADLSEAAREEGRDVAETLARVDDLVQQFPDVIVDLGVMTESYTRQLTALGDLYAAEVRRSRRDSDEGAAWSRAAASLRLAAMPWEEAYACWRGAAAMLTGRAGHREEASALLHTGYRLANKLQALPFRTAIEDLARGAHVSLGGVAPQARTAEPGGLAGLTVREREILEHVVAGWTYGEIARALFISEKTVSSHISNLLRKTGTANRVDLARFATRARRSVSG